MAIFKSKHKKDQNSASNRADAGASQPASPQRAGAGAGGGPGTLDSSHNTLKGSLGRANGHAQQQQNGPYANGSMASSAPGDGGSRLFASAGSANSASNAPYGLVNGSGPGAFPPHESGGYPGPIAPSSSSFPTGPNGIPSGMIAPLHQQPQPQQPQLGSSHPRATTLSSSSGSSHTVLYPWSQRRVALLPSQHLAPLAPSDSPSLASSPVLGPTSPLPFPRYGHSVNPIATATPTGDLYIFGGLVQNSVRNDLYVVHANSASNPTAPQQQQHQLQQPGGTVGIALVETRGEVPGPRVGHASVGVGNVLIVWGGDTKTRPEERQDDGLYLLNLSTRDWTRVKTVGRSPEGRYGHAVAMVGSRFFVFGGQTDDGGFKNDLCYFDLQKLKQGQPSWTFIDPQPGQLVPPARTGHTCVTYGDSLYIFGGTDGQYHYNDTWQYDLSTGVWTELACIGYIPVPREGHAATLVDDVMYIFGGRGVDGKDLDDLAAFKISNFRWFMFQNMGPAPSGRSGHAMATHGTKVLVLGGESYTSGRADDPSLVHILDTTKIKYPPDSRPAAQQQQHAPNTMTTSPPLKAQMAPLVGPYASPPTSPPPSQLPPPIGTGKPIARKPSLPTQMSAPELQTGADARTREASPPQPSSPAGREPQTQGLVSSLEEAGAVPGSPPAKSPPQPQVSSSMSAPAVSLGSMPPPPSPGRKPPPRPARSDDADAFRTSPNAFASRERSPTMANGEWDGRRPQGDAQAQPPNDAFYYRDPVGGASPQQPQHPQSQPAARSPPAAESSATPVAASASASESVAKLEREKAWLLLEVERLRKGDVPREADGSDDVDAPERLSEAPGDAGVRAALLEMKKQLAAAQDDLSRRVAASNDRVQEAERGRLAALQEATYARAKAAALESGSGTDLAAVERERTAALEQQLANALASQTKLHDQVAKLEKDGDHHQSLRTAAEERCEEALSRAHDAEERHTQVLAELHALRSKADEHERSVAEHAERNASLTSSSRQLEDENVRLRSDAESHDKAVEHWLAAVAASEAALLAAHKRNDEISSSWDQATRQLEEHQSRVSELERRVETLQAERDAAKARADEAVKVHSATREANDQSFALASGGLAQLLKLRGVRGAGSQARARSRSVPHDDGDVDRTAEGEAEAGPDTEANPVHEERAVALQGELEAVKKLHGHAQARQAELVTELSQARERETGLHTQLAQTRTQLALVQKEHTKSRDDLRQRDLDLAEHETAAKEARRARDAAEVRSGVLRNLLVEHGLVKPEQEDLTAQITAMTGDESAEQLGKRVQELEAELATRQHQRGQIEERVQEHEAEVTRLRNELEQERSGATGVRERADRAQEDLEALQGRHQQLEATHLKAVQYVKGTEKMLRRMKEELNRYKERCEQLDSPERKQELDQLRAQVDDLRQAAQTSAREVEDLKIRMSVLQQQLGKARGELEETLAINASLNAELQAALRNNASPSQGATNLSSLHLELDQAQNRAEWLKRENSSLEARCRTAESKIAILLDHMEGLQGDHQNPPGSSEHNASDARHDDNHDWHAAEQQRVASPSGMPEADEPQRRL